MADQDSTPTTDELTALRARVAELEAGCHHKVSDKWQAKAMELAGELEKRDARIAQVLALCDDMKHTGMSYGMYSEVRALLVPQETT